MSALGVFFPGRFPFRKINLKLGLELKALSKMSMASETIDKLSM